MSCRCVRSLGDHLSPLKEPEEQQSHVIQPLSGAVCGTPAPQSTAYFSFHLLPCSSLLSESSTDCCCCFPPDDFPKPQIIIQPETTVAVLGKDIRFTCLAASSSSSPMMFAWKKDNEMLHNAEIENFAHVRAKDGEVMECTTILHLRHVTFAHEGRYQCVITNHFGSTYSNKARLTVNGEWQLLPHPSPQPELIRGTIPWDPLSCSRGSIPDGELLTSAQRLFGSQWMLRNALCEGHTPFVLAAIQPSTSACMFLTALAASLWLLR